MSPKTKKAKLEDSKNEESKPDPAAGSKKEEPEEKTTDSGKPKKKPANPEKAEKDKERLSKASAPFKHTDTFALATHLLIIYPLS